MSESQSDTLSTSKEDVVVEKAEQVLRQRKNAEVVHNESASVEPPKESPKPRKAKFPSLKELQDDLGKNFPAGVLNNAPRLFFQTVQALSDSGPDGLTLFLVTWLPLLLAGVGAVLGFLFSASGMSFVLGCAGAFLTMNIFKSPQEYNDTKPNGSLDRAIIVFIFLPLLMMDASGWLLPIFLMIASSGAPYVLASLPTKIQMNEKTAVLSLTVASVVTFGVSSGGTGIVNALMLAALYTAAGYIVPFIPPNIFDQAKAVPVLKEHVFAHEGLAQVGLQNLFAKVLLYVLYGLLLPDFLFETQNNFFSDIIYTAIGFGVLGGGFFLQRPNTPSTFKLGLVGAVFGSYVMILLILVAQEIAEGM